MACDKNDVLSRRFPSSPESPPVPSRPARSIRTQKIQNIGRIPDPRLHPLLPVPRPRGKNRGYHNMSTTDLPRHKEPRCCTSDTPCKKQAPARLLCGARPARPHHQSPPGPQTSRVSGGGNERTLLPPAALLGWTKKNPARKDSSVVRNVR